jgi:hypothetical protein
MKVDSWIDSIYMDGKMEKDQNLRDKALFFRMKIP